VTKPVDVCRSPIVEQEFSVQPVELVNNEGIDVLDSDSEKEQLRLLAISQRNYGKVKC